MKILLSTILEILEIFKRRRIMMVHWRPHLVAGLLLMRLGEVLIILVVVGLWRAGLVQVQVWQGRMFLEVTSFFFCILQSFYCLLLYTFSLILYAYFGGWACVEAHAGGCFTKMSSKLLIEGRKWVVLRSESTDISHHHMTLPISPISHCHSHLQIIYIHNDYNHFLLQIYYNNKLRKISVSSSILKLEIWSCPADYAGKPGK